MIDIQRYVNSKVVVVAINAEDTVVMTTDVHVCDIGPGQLFYYAFAGFLFWSVFIVQVPYVDSIMGGPSVMFYIVLAYGVTANCVRGYSVWYYTRTYSSTTSVSKLLYWGGIGTAVIMCMYPLMLASVASVNATGVGFWLCIALTTFIGTTNSLLINAGYVLMSLSQQRSQLAFMIAHAVTPVVCWPTLIALRRSVVVVMSASEPDNATTIGVTVVTISLVFGGLLTFGVIPLYSFRTNRVVEMHRTPEEDALSTTAQDPEFVPHAHVSKHCTNIFMPILRSAGYPIFVIWLTNFFNYCVFPSQINLWSPSREQTAYTAESYKSFLVYIYSVADMCGRFTAFLSPSILHVGSKKLFVFAIIRGLTFCPIFIISTTYPTVLSNDFARLAFVFAFGLTTGCLVTLATVSAPESVLNIRATKYLVGLVLSFVAVNGLLCGTFAGILIKKLIIDT